MIVGSACLSSDAFSQHLRSYWDFSYLGCGVSLHGCSSKAQLLLLTLDVGYLLATCCFSAMHGLLQNWERSASKLGKEYIKAVYCHPACLTYIQSTSCKMPGWIDESQAGIKIAGRNNNLRDAYDTALMAELVKRH